MKYMGGKTRIAVEVANAILDDVTARGGVRAQ